jgi:hypothetical protein
MRTVDEIKTDIKLCSRDEFPELLAELWLALTGDIDIDRLVEICEAEKDGRLVVLPCKVGTPVWSTMFRKIISDDNGKFIREEPTSNWPFDTDMISDWGECWFMTREEAEAALDKQRGE